MTSSEIKAAFIKAAKGTIAQYQNRIFMSTVGKCEYCKVSKKLLTIRNTIGSFHVHCYHCVPFIGVFGCTKFESYGKLRFLKDIYNPADISMMEDAETMFERRIRFHQMIIKELEETPDEKFVEEFHLNISDVE